MNGLAFDQVTVRKTAGVNLLSAAEWMSIPTLEQFDLISEKRVEFLREGEKVKVIDAVRSMQLAQTQAEKKSA